MKKEFIKSFALTAVGATFASTLFTPVSQVDAQTETESGVLEFESNVAHEGEPIEGGTLRIALVGDPFAGVLNPIYYSGNPDATIIDYFSTTLYGYDENFQIDDSGFANIELNQEEKSVTITIPEGVTWHDGEEVTIDDVIYPYYVIGHKDYTGIRYNSAFENVVGMVEYHNGETEEISGIERVDDYTAKIHYINFTNSMIQAGGDISSFVIPEHIFSEIPIAEQEDSAAVRQNPIGFGPFKVESITPGEAVTFVRNEDYYRGAPNIERIELEVVNPTNIVSELRNGNYDIASLPADQYDTFSDATNFSILGRLDNAYTYIGFKLGTWDAEAGEVQYDPERQVSDKALRQAMAYAVDNDAIGVEFYHGLRHRANSHIPSLFTAYHNADQEGYTYNPERAKEILAEAGYQDLDGDGFVEDPNGEKLELTFASMSGGEVAEPIAQYYIQSWQAVGINVSLYQDQLIEFNTFYDLIKADEPSIDVYQAAWGVGGDPNPSGFFGRNASFNYPRWATEENDELLAAISSDAAFEDEFRQQAFYDWQAYMIEEVPTFPTLFRNALTAVNKRVSQWDIGIGNQLEWDEIYLTAEQPISE